MKNQIIRLCASFGTAAVVATTTGCSTLAPTTMTTDDCMVSTRTENKLLLAFVFTTNTGEQYSSTCRDGKSAAATTLIGRKASGELHPVGAAFAVTFHNNLLKDIQSGIENAQARATDIERHFKAFLLKMGGISIEVIKKQLEESQDNRPSSVDSEVPTPETPKPLPKKCNGSSILKSCPS